MNKKFTFLKVYWMINKDCDYNCWFCGKYMYKNSENLSFKNILNIANFINDNTGEKSFVFIGNTAEPLQYNHIESVLPIFNKRQKLYLETSLIPNIDQIKKFQPKLKNFIIFATFHAEFANPIEFYEKIKYLHDNGTQIKIKFTFEKNDYDYIMERYYPLYCKIYENFNNIDIKITTEIKNFKTNEFNKIDRNLLNTFYDYKIYKEKDPAYFINYNDSKSYSYIFIDLSGNIFKLNSNLEIDSKSFCYNLTDYDYIKKHNIYKLKVKIS